MPYRFIISIYCLLLVFSLHAQSDKQDGFGIETNLLAGRIIRHSFSAPIPSMSEALDVNLVWQTYGKKLWHQGCHFPVIGIGATYTNYGSDRVFGQCVGIYPNMQIPIYRSDRLEFTFRLGDGLGYVTRKYQTTKPIDTVNTAIGSHLNDFAIFMLDLRIHLNQHWNLQFGGNFTHISNSDYHQPNLGINMAGTHIGIQYFPTTNRPKRIVREFPKPKNWWVFDIRAALSYKEARANGNPILPAYITAASVGRHWHGKNKLYAGIDYAYHKDIYAFLKNYGVDYGHERAHAWDGGVFVGNEFLVGRLGLITQAGIYYRQTFLKFDPLYEKIGCNYYILKRSGGPLKELFLSAMLLTHGIVAQYSEFGLGVGF